MSPNIVTRSAFVEQFLIELFRNAPPCAFIACPEVALHPFKLLIPPDAEESDNILDQVENGAGRVHSSPGSARIHHARPGMFFVVADVGVPEQNVIIILGFNSFHQPGFVVTVKHSDFPPG